MAQPTMPQSSGEPNWATWSNAAFRSPGTGPASRWRRSSGRYCWRRPNRGR